MMARRLSTWAFDRSTRHRPRVTLFGDLFGFARSGWGRRQKPPTGAPLQESRNRGRVSLSDVLAPHITGWLHLRVDFEVVGADALTGLETPFVLGVNHCGQLGYRVLRMSLPAQLRPDVQRPSRALSRRRNVAVMSAHPASGRLVGEFDSEAAALASQHSVALVPVGVVGTLGLKEILRLALNTKPKVSIRFGAPIYVRGRSLAEATELLQSRVERLVSEGDLSWWEVERRRVTKVAADDEAAPRWRRLWSQAAPRPEEKGSRIWTR